MQPQPQSDISSFSPQQTGTIYQKVIPWWADLDPTVLSELALPANATMPAHRVDIAVIGAGVAGLSAALSAQLAGAQVVVLEKEGWLGYGATGRNAGILSAG